ncbi:MAG: response regulator [Anaerolineae bacterium]|nr:response regulator [Anaerolineae bacterium]
MNLTPDNIIPANRSTQIVLVIDDTPANLETMTDYLETFGLEIVVAQNGNSGIERAHYVQPDLILLDVILPGIDGFEVCRRLKADATTRDIPIIFMTALTETEHKVQAFQAGAVDYITKPFQKEEVLARVRTHLRLHALNQQLEQKVQERTAALVHANQQLEKEIARHKRSDAALLESEERFRRLAENARDMIYRMTLPDGKYEYISPAALDLFGYTPEEFYESPFLIKHVIHPGWVDYFEEQWANLLAGQAPPSYEYQVIHKPGEAKWLNQRNVLICDENGHPVAIEGIVTDITARKRAEEEGVRLLAELQEYARRVQQIIDTVPEGVVLLDANAQVVSANPMAVSDLQVLANAKVGDTLTRLGEKPLTDILTSPPKGLWHEMNIEHRVFQIIARSIEIGPTLEGWVLVIRDVTRQREVDRRVQQQERLAAVGQLAAGIAHDFNNIMATIVLYAQMSARADGVPERIRERLSTINQQAQYASNLIRQILDFSRRAVVERRSIDLLPFLKAQVQLLERTLPENIHIKLDYGPEEYVIDADLTSMQQMLMNLSVNARDAMPQGGSLHIGLERLHIDKVSQAPVLKMQPGDWIGLRISDTGMGIPRDLQDRIFEPFFTTKPPGQGSGLGLAQVHGIVGIHEGHITVESQVNVGTTFNIYFPALSLQAPILPEIPADTLTQGHNEVILIVEDNETARLALVESLEQLNYRVLEAADGKEALKLLTRPEEQIDLVLSDVIMPEMGGIALLHALRKRNLRVPILLLTGHPMENELEALHTSEKDTRQVAWMLKPPSIEKLTETIAQMLSDTIKT